MGRNDEEVYFRTNLVVDLRGSQFKKNLLRLELGKRGEP